MSSRLIVLIDEHWPTRASAPWVLIGEDGRLQSEGESEPRHWPPADDCAMVLTANQCAWHETRLPRGARREEARLLAYALEERLLRDPDSQHLVVVHREAEEGGVRVGVLVVARERLRSLGAQFAAIGRPLAAAHAELQSAPGGGDDTWRLTLTDHGIVLRPGAAPALAFDPPLGHALPLLHQALAAARARNAAPPEIVVHAAPGVDPPSPEAAIALAVALPTAKPYLWWEGAAGTANLLQGEFAPRHRRSGWTGRLRGPLRLAAASLAILLLASLGEVAWQRQRLHELEARMQRLFETTLPNTPAIAPAAQLQRRLDELRTRHGRLREDDLLALLAAYAKARGVATRDSVGALDYRDGRLRLALPSLAAPERDRLTARLAAIGYQVEAGDSATQLVLTTEPIR
ncbi:MAG: hypothetical protein KDG52_00490 [Rhodocyclaceae bacterium]|nr:hypothetical protein [Rhodocyclaceae bacterium]